MQQLLQVVDRADERTTERGIPRQRALVHPAADTLDGRGEVSKCWKLGHGGSSAQGSGHPLYRVWIRTTGATREQQTVELFDVFTGFEDEELEKSRTFRHARSIRCARIEVRKGRERRPWPRAAHAPHL